MNSEINLISGKKLDLEKQEKTLKYLKIIALGSLLLVGSTAIIFFLIIFFTPISSIKKQQQDTIQGLSGLHNKLVTYSLNQERLKTIKTIMSKRKTYPKTLDGILNKLPGDLNVSGISISQGSLILSISGKSLLSMNQYIDDIMLFSDNNSKLSNLTVNSLQYNNSSSDFTLAIQAKISD
jgi:hypothetical protein